MTPDGPFMVDRGAINPRDNSGVAPDGEPPFDGQLFFHPTRASSASCSATCSTAPSSFTLDLALGKETEIGEGRSLKFGAKVANILNHPVFYAGDQNIGSSQFGRIGRTLVDARVVELYLRYKLLSARARQQAERILALTQLEACNRAMIRHGTHRRSVS